MASSTNVSPSLPPRTAEKKVPKVRRKHSGNSLFATKTSTTDFVTTLPRECEAPPDSACISPGAKKQTAAGDAEFLIAADLTQYANPLRCLRRQSSPLSKKRVAYSSEAETESEEKEAYLVAVDTAKYTSPLDDLLLKN